MSILVDKQSQLDHINAGLLSGETVVAVLDGIGVGTGFIGITDKRVIIQDKSFIGGKNAVTSVPYSKVTTVSTISDKSIFGSTWGTSSIVISTATANHRVDFRGPDKAKYVHDYILWKIM